MESKEQITMTQKELPTGTMFITNYPAGLFYKNIPVSKAIIVKDWRIFNAYIDSITTLSK